MGCFFACFGSSSSKDPKRVHHQQSTVQTNAIPKPLQSSVYTLPHHSNTQPSHPILEAGNGRLNISTTEEVTSVKTHEDAASEKLIHLKEDNSAKSSKKPESSSEDFAPTFRSSCPPIHSYKNCKDSDDEDEVFDTHLANDAFGMVESTKAISSVVDSSMFVCEVNRKNSRLRTAYICPVPNPVENLSQWNAVKSEEALPPTPQKENLELERESTVEEFPYSCKSKAFKSGQEPSVDASLSTWLASSETTPVSKMTTGMALEDTITPVKSSTLEGSSEMHVVGTVVDTYWRQGVNDKDHDSASSFKGIPNTTSKYREDKTVNWHSTPFETRLERALNSRRVAKP